MKPLRYKIKSYTFIIELFMLFQLQKLLANTFLNFLSVFEISILQKTRENLILNIVYHIQ